MINTSIFPRNILSFKKIPIEHIKNVNLASEYTFVSPDYRDYFVRSDFDSYDKKLSTVIDNNDDFNIASNEAEVDLSDNTLYAKNLLVFNPDKRCKGFGVVLHLNNVINLLENDLDNIKLYSLGSAVLFHSKCKFEPDIKDSKTLLELISEISDKDSADFPEIEDITQKAYNFLLIAGYKRNGIKDFHKFLQEGNEIIHEYLDIISSKKLGDFERYKYGLFEGLNMILTREKILENKDFYNKLFKKYNIDYEIKDPQ